MKRLKAEMQFLDKGKRLFPLQMKLKDLYYPGDIVQILHSVKHPWAAGQCFKLHPNIDTRYVGVSFSRTEEQYDNPKNHTAYVSYSLLGLDTVGPGSIILQKRPLKNWIRHLMVKITGVYHQYKFPIEFLQ